MALLWILLYLPAVALLLRAYSSHDLKWLRIIGATLGALTVAVPLIGYAVRVDLGLWVLALFSTAILFLLGWTAMSKDAAASRVASAAAGLAGAFPVLLLYLFANSYRE
ncbi:MAG TPA: hypothetical protein VFO45_07795 [Sphingomicrobium sp.]|nr:hypothetical protein [Sphingomicrobium sp.]